MRNTCKYVATIHQLLLDICHFSGISQVDGKYKGFTQSFLAVSIRMIAEERRQKLADIVRQKGFVPLPDLVVQMGVSESTVRRDLDFLHEAGVLRRTHGGAIATAGEWVSPRSTNARSRKLKRRDTLVAAWRR